MKRSLLIFISLLTFLGSRSANQHIQFSIDSLKAANQHESNKENMIINLLEIADLWSYSNTDSAITYTYLSLKEAEHGKLEKVVAEAKYMLSFYYDQKGKSDSAIQYMEDAVTLFSELKDSSYLIGCYNNLGVYYSYGDNPEKGLQYFIKAKHLAETCDETFSLSETYTNIGSFYELLEDYHEALSYYQKSLDLDTQNNYIENIALSNMYIGCIYIELKKFDEAKTYLDKTLAYLPQIEYQPYIQELYLDLAHFYIETNHLDTTQYYLNKARKLDAKQNLPSLMVFMHKLEADMLFKQGRFAETIHLYDKSIVIYKRLKDNSNLAEIYQSKSEVYWKLNQHEKAYKALREANIFRKQIKSNEIARILGEFEQTEIQKAEMEQLRLEQKLNNEILKREKTDNKNQLQLATFSAVMLLLVLIIVSLYSLIKKNHASVLQENNHTINKQKELIQRSYNELASNEQKLKKLNDTKDKFFSIVAHDLKNPFNVLIGMSDIIRSDSNLRNTEEFDEIIEGMYQSATTGYNLLENLLEWSRTQTGEISFTPRTFTINKILNTNKLFFREAAKRKNIDILLPNENYDVYADYNMVNFIVRNLINNALKFSHINSKIELTIQQEVNKLKISVKDYGIGMNKEILQSLFKLQKQIQQYGTAQEKGTGLGLILCKEFIEKNKGNIYAESSPGAGSTFIFTLPLS